MKLNLPLRSRFSRLRWHTRLVLWTAAAAAGLAVIGFALLTNLALEGFAALVAGRTWLPFLLAPGIGMIVVWLTQRYFPNSQGSGIPQVIAAIHLAHDNRPVVSLLSLRIACGKVFLGAFALLGGYSAGREGPSVQVAASILAHAHRYLPHTRAIRAGDLIIAGGAAGIAAAFNTPLAGIVFAVEELGRKLETRTSGILLSAIILAGLMSLALLGNYNYFGTFAIGEIRRDIVLPLLACAIVCGILGGIFSRILLWPVRHPHWRLWIWRKAHPVLFAGTCGLAVAVIGWLTGGTSFGSGYAITASALNGDTVLSWNAPLARFLATLVTYFSGIPGGIFAPSLAVGAAVGFDCAALFGSAVAPHTLVAICMAGFLAAVTQSPITAAVIVMEMIDNHGMVIPLMAAALIAKAVSSRFGPELYRQLSVGFVGPVATASAHKQ